MWAPWPTGNEHQLSVPERPPTDTTVKAIKETVNTLV